MVNNINFKQDLEDFIRDRIEESYKIVSNKKEYKEQYQKFKELETNFIKKLQDKTIIEDYYYFRDIRMDLDTKELQESYLIGVNYPLFKANGIAVAYISKEIRA